MGEIHLMKKSILLIAFSVFVSLFVSAQTTTYLTYQTPLNSNYQLFTTSPSTGGGVVTLPTIGSCFCNIGNVISTQTIGSGDALIARIRGASSNYFGIGLAASQPSDYRSLQYTIQTAQGAANDQTGAVENGTLKSLINGTNNQWVRIRWDAGTNTIKYGYSNDGSSFTDVYTSAVTPSGTYYVVVGAIVQDAGFQTVYKLGTAGNQSPIASAGANQTITLPTSSFTLNGTGSDPDGTVASYAWTKITGPSGPTITSASSAVTTVTGVTTAGTYVYQLTVTDNLGATAISATTITVNSAGIVGTFSVFAGSDQFLAAGTSTTSLSGSYTVNDSVELIVIWGESNADGYGENALASAPEKNVRTVEKIYNPNTNQFESMQLGVNNNLGGASPDPTNQHSFELAIANMADSGRFGPTPVYVVKMGAGGSYIAQWLPGSTRGLFEEQVPRLDSAMAQLTRSGKKFRVTVWQTIGLNDRFNQGTTVDSFLNRLSRFRSALRTRIGRSNTPFIMTQFFQGYEWNTNFQAIRQTDPLVSAVPTEGAVFVPGMENVHWGYEGFKFITRRMIDSMLTKRGTSVSWSKVSGPAGSAVTNPTYPITQMTGLVSGTHVYALSGTGGYGYTSTDTIVITVGSGASSGNNAVYARIPYTSPDFLAPGRGAEYWNNQAFCDCIGGSPTIPQGATAPLDRYYRFNWFDLEGDTQGSYTWTVFDNQINQAIDLGQKFNFGIMNRCGGCEPTKAGATMAYPLYLHTLMQSEATKDFVDNNSGYARWTPNYNSLNFIARYSAVMRATADHINATSYKGVPYKNVIGYVDNRWFGDFGEYDAYPIMYSGFPAGTAPTITSFKKFIDSNLAIFPNYPQNISMSAFFPDDINIGTGNAAVCDYIAKASNAWGRMGWRRDNWGDNGYLVNIQNNTTSYLGGPTMASYMLDTLWRYAPIGGEPSSSTGATSNSGNNQPFYNLQKEIIASHASYFGNGNYVFNGNDITLAANVRAASRAAGYRYIITGGYITPVAASGGQFNVSLDWKNVGIAPTYEKWNIVYELRNPTTGAVVWSDSVNKSNFKLFRWGTDTTTTKTVSQIYTLPTIAQGTYNLHMIIKDSLKYRQPLPLGIQGRQSDGSYVLYSGVQISGTPVNQVPIISAQTAVTVVSPATTSTITASASDPDGSVASASWVQVTGASVTLSGTTTNTLSISGLAIGVYSFRYTAIDNLGASNSVVVTVTVQPTPLSAGANQTITLPTSSVTLAAVQSGLTTPTWTQLGGPNTAVLATPNAVSTLASGLTSGVYLFQLTMFSGATQYTSTVQITVLASTNANIAPSASAGIDQILYAPSNTSTTLVGSGADIDGIVSAYSWYLISGPNTPTITSPTSSTTTVTTLVSGTYKFALVVVDNSGASSRPDTIQVVVSASTPGVAPTADAGQNILVRTPTTSCYVYGNNSVANVGATIASYAWTKVSGPVGSVIASPSASITQITGLTLGSYTFRLTVTDSNGLTATDDVNVTVTATPVRKRRVFIRHN